MTAYKVTPEFVELVEAMREAQRMYFAMVNDRTNKYQPHQKRGQLEKCKRYEREVDQWVNLYKEERARWEKFVAGNVGASAASDDMAQPALMPEGQKPTHTHSF